MARATTSSTPLTVTFSEDAKGWVCFKSFIQDSGLSLNNDYYTLKDGELWKHHDNQLRNTFYGDHMFSHVDVLFNEESATVKSFASMKYEGTQAKITKNLGDKEYYNNEGHPGWYVESGITDLQLAGEMEFKDKEGKWFSYMKGVPVETVADLDSKEFSFQGIDIFTTNQSGCLRPGFNNYDPNANLDCLGKVVTEGHGDTSCCCDNYGCIDDTPGIWPLDMDINGNGYDRNGSPCSFPCTDDSTPTGNPLGFAAFNYDPNFDCDDGSCFYPRWYCDTQRCQPDIDSSTSLNQPYEDYLECIGFGCETPGVIPGCMDDGNMGQPWWIDNYAASTGITSYNFSLGENYNYNSQANTDDGSCCYATGSGCPDPTACNYDDTACPNSSIDHCTYAGCNDPIALNYEPWHVGCICDDPTNFSCCTYSSTTYTLTVKDLGDQDGSTPNNYTVSEHIETGIASGTNLGILQSTGPVIATTPYKLIIEPNPGYTVQASDFNINSSSPAYNVGTPTNSVAPSFWTYWDIGGAGSFSGGNADTSAGTGPYSVGGFFMDSENPTNDPTWVTTLTNKVIFQAWIGSGWTMGSTIVYMPSNDLTVEIDIDGDAQISTIISGCTDPTATNYNPLAIVDDGSCIYGVSNLVDCATITGVQFEGCDDWNNVMNGVSSYTLSSLTTHWYNSLSTQGYQILANGLPFTFANLQLLMGGPNGCCGEPVSGTQLGGCTDSLAENYSPLATYDDQSCCYQLGCWQ